MKSQWYMLVAFPFTLLVVALVGAWVAVFDAQIGVAAGVWSTLGICAAATLLVALGRQSEADRSVGQILNDLENPARIRASAGRR